MIFLSTQSYRLNKYFKIMFYNLLPKSGEDSHARGCAPFLILYLLKGIRVNISRLIVNYMISKNLLILSRNLPFGMMITHLLKYFKIDLSFETAFSPSVNIDHTLLKRLKVGTREHAHQAPPSP